MRSTLERTLTRIEDDDDSTICEESGTELLDDSDDAVESASNSSHVSACDINAIISTLSDIYTI